MSKSNKDSLLNISLERINTDCSSNSNIANQNKTSTDIKQASSIKHNSAYNVAHILSSKYLEYSNAYKHVIEPNLNEAVTSYHKIYSLCSNYNNNRRLRTETNNIFLDTLNYILNADNKSLLSIDGFSGTGKSTFLQIMYEIIRKDASVNLTPLYIDIQYYERQVYEGCETEDEIYKAAVELLKLDFAPLIQQCNTNYIVFIDGFTTYERSPLNISQEVINIVSSNLKTISIISQSNLEKYDSGEGKDNPIFLSFKRIRTQSELCDDFIDNIAKINYPKVETYDKDKIKGILNEYKITNIDLMTISQLLSYNNLSNIKKTVSYSKFIQNCFIDCYNDIGNCMITSKDKIKSIIIKAGELAFKRYVLEKPISPDKIVNSIEWKVLHIHDRYRFYVIAYYAILYIKDKKEAPLGDNLISEHIYPSELNVFSTCILKSSDKNQILVFKSIESSYDKSATQIRAHSCYLLGRITERTIKDQVGPLLESFLNKELDELKKLENMKELNNNNCLQKYDMQEKELLNNKINLLMIIRTIYISLAYINNEIKSREYIDCLFTKQDWDNLNRGFHLEYYGDIASNPSEKMTHKDALNIRPNNTFTSLSTSIINKHRSGKQQCLKEIELHTLCSLAINRHVHGLLDSELLDQTVDTLAYLLKHRDNQTFNSSKIEPFIELTIYSLSNQNFCYMTLLQRLYELKFTLRAGWTSKVDSTLNSDNLYRKVERCESVADHTLGCYMIGMLYLPETKDEKIKYPWYSKETILKMLIVHDFGESIIGDIRHSDKESVIIDKEGKANDILSCLSIIDGIFGIDDLNKLWYEIEFMRKENGEVAKDLDKLENYFQIMMYKLKGSIIPDEKDWRHKLADSIKSDQGRAILKKMTDREIDIVSPMKINDNISLDLNHE